MAVKLLKNTWISFLALSSINKKLNEKMGNSMILLSVNKVTFIIGFGLFDGIVNYNPT